MIKSKMLSSDWKVFKKIREAALQKFYVETIAEFSEIVADENKTEQERYRAIYSGVQRAEKALRLTFDGLSRNDALLQLLSMRAKGLVEKEWLEQLSDEFEKATDPNRGI